MPIIVLMLLETVAGTPAPQCAANPNPAHFAGFPFSVIEWNLWRDDCEAICRSEGLPTPATAHYRQEQGEGVTDGATLDIPHRMTHK